MKTGGKNNPCVTIEWKSGPCVLDKVECRRLPVVNFTHKSP